MLKKTLGFFKKFFSISAFKIGFFVTLSCVYISLNYYNIHPDEIEYDMFYGTLDLIHKKNVDLKMRTRGPRHISPEIVLVTVDEESLKKIGRWVWPRSVFSKLLSELSESKVAVSALDVIFAEPEVAQGIHAIEDIHSKINDPKLKNYIQEKIKNLDNDLKLSQSISKYANQIILGSYFTDEEYRENAYQDLCFNQIYERTKEFEVMNSYEYPIGVLDSSLTEDKIVYTELPEVIRVFLNKVFDKIEKETQSQIKTESPSEIHLLSNEKLRRFCSQFLKTEENKNLFRANWSLFQKQEDNLKKITADEWFTGVQKFNLKNPIHGASFYETNTPEISKSATSTAFFRAFLDQDGVIRKAKLVARYGSKIIPSMALEAYLRAKQYNIMIEIQENPDLLNSPQGNGSKIINNFSFFSNETGDVVQKFPIDEYSKININYAGPKNTFPYISASEILGTSEKIKVYQNVLENGIFKQKTYLVTRSEYLKNKIALIGATATGIYDLRVSPLDSDFPGLEIHANILDNLLQNNMYRSLNISVIDYRSILNYMSSFLNPQKKDEPTHYERTEYSESYYMPLFLLILGLGLSFIISEVGALWGFLTLLTFTISLTLFDYYILFLNNYVITIIFPLFSTFSIYLVLTFYKYLTEERKKQELKGTFQKYVSPSIVNEILSHPEKVELGGRKERMTVLFSDIRGFTTFAEKLDPKILGDFLNSYLTPMTRLVFKNNGTLDKYMGDAIMAFFGAPIHFNDHAKKCCITALEMIEQLSELNKKFEEQGLPSIDIGIGMNTGDMSVGNMGSDIVRSYTVMGDSVNLASRLEGINKSYGTRIIISQFTYEDIKNDFICRELDLVRVKGKGFPVKIYELVAQSQITDHQKNCLEFFKQGYSLYLEKQFSTALETFNKALNQIPNDGPSQLYIQRCEEYIKDPPPDNWDGVYEFKTK